MFEKFLISAVVTMATFGSWKSPITTDLIVQESINFYEMQSDADFLYWTELHPKENGRIALVRYDGKGETSLAKDKCIRSRVHEYGGGAFALCDRDVTYSNDEDRQLYSLKKGKKLTDHPEWRFADGCQNI